MALVLSMGKVLRTIAFPMPLGYPFDKLLSATSLDQSRSPQERSSRLSSSSSEPIEEELVSDRLVVEAVTAPAALMVDSSVCCRRSWE